LFGIKQARKKIDSVKSPSHQDASSEQCALLNSRGQENYTKADLRGLFHPKHGAVRPWSHRELNWSLKYKGSFAPR